MNHDKQKVFQIFIVTWNTSFVYHVSCLYRVYLVHNRSKEVDGGDWTMGYSNFYPYNSGEDVIGINSDPRETLDFLQQLVLSFGPCLLEGDIWIPLRLEDCYLTNKDWVFAFNGILNYLTKKDWVFAFNGFLNCIITCEVMLSNFLYITLWLLYCYYSQGLLLTFNYRIYKRLSRNYRIL